MSEQEPVTGEVVATVAVRTDEQDIVKEYDNCAPLKLDDGVGWYKIVKVDPETGRETAETPSCEDDTQVNEDVKRQLADEDTDTK